MTDLPDSVLGMLGLALFIIYKMVTVRFPQITGNDHAKRSADTLERIEKHMDAANATNKELLDIHTDQFARRENGTPRWYNDPDREAEIHETNENVKEIKHVVKRLAPQ